MPFSFFILTPTESTMEVEHRRARRSAKKCIRGKRPKGKQKCCHGVKKGSRHGHKRGVCKK